MFSLRERLDDHIFRQVDLESQDNSTKTVILYLTQMNNDRKEEIIQSFQVEMLKSSKANENNAILIQDNERTLILNLNASSESKSCLPNESHDESNDSIASLPTYNCSKCLQKFMSKRLLGEHFRIQHCKSYECEVCGLAVGSPSALKHHIKYRHSENRPYSCELCENKFKSFCDLQRHSFTHSKEAPFSCDQCEFVCRSNQSLTKHFKEVHESVTFHYVCHVCNKSFTRGNNLTRHLIRIHKYQLEQGKTRFQYCKCGDGTFRLKL